MSKQLELLQKLTDATMQRPQFIASGGGDEGGMPGWTGFGRSFAEGGVSHKPRTTKIGDGGGGDGDGDGGGISEGGLTEDSKVAGSSCGRSENVDTAKGSEGTLLEAPEERLLLIYETIVRLFRLCKNVRRRGARNACAFSFSINVLSLQLDSATRDTLN